MNTPICDFLKKYASDDNIRLHMPGHKGKGDIERLDLTEVRGADSLYEASGIIKESEENASSLFGAHTFYSAEGSSLSIRAMLYLASLTEKEKKPLILAGRNAHKVFVSAAALLDFDIEWMMGGESYLSCRISAPELAERLDGMTRKPTAVYITSPDYLGNTVDVASLAKVCHERGVLLLVDNAHGAYLAFLEPSMHPIALGADMCADSAHKTLPCLTGAAYLHISKNMPDSIAARAKGAMALFGSTSPSYLILGSLDKANAYLDGGYRARLRDFVGELAKLKERLVNAGYTLVGEEPMKLTVAPKSYGYTGCELAEYLEANHVIPEFSDPDYLVLMPTPQLSSGELQRLEVLLSSLPRKKAITDTPPALSLPERVMSPREAIMSENEAIGAANAEGRILSAITVGCPPAVPIVVSGERITKGAIDAFKYYGIKTCYVIK